MKPRDKKCQPSSAYPCFICLTEQTSSNRIVRQNLLHDTGHQLRLIFWETIMGRRLYLKESYQWVHALGTPSFHSFCSFHCLFFLSASLSLCLSVSPCLSLSVSVCLSVSLSDRNLTYCLMKYLPYGGHSMNIC